ncbi:MAG: hypothetical protein Q8O42_15420 [Acidobacteriota bacterium]|nr:hypothetical protein [Acidobacteriota bacterium]
MLNSPSACRNGHPCQPVGLKESVSCAVYHGPEGSLVDPIATALDLKPGTLRDAINPNEPDWIASKHLDAIARFTAGHPAMAQHFSGLQRGFFYRVDIIGSEHDGLTAKTAKSVVEFGEFLQALGAGPITPEQLVRLRKEGMEAQAAIQAVVVSAERRLAGAAR